MPSMGATSWGNDHPADGAPTTADYYWCSPALRPHIVIGESVAELLQLPYCCNSLLVVVPHIDAHRHSSKARGYAANLVVVRSRPNHPQPVAEFECVTRRGDHATTRTCMCSPRT